MHFATPGKCKYGARCEYRHHPLTESERIYMMMLEPLGTAFVARSDAYVKAKGPTTMD
jgi:hypothetical protein